ncbi:MAG: hypothetical protein ACK4OP_13850, partial [Gemmobacter sp.]
PITAHFIAKAQVHRAVPRADLPSPATDCEWATFDTAREGGRVEVTGSPAPDSRAAATARGARD